MTRPYLLMSDRSPAANGEIVKWDCEYQSVFISQQLAAMVQSGEDDDGNEINLENEIDQLEVGLCEV